MKKRLIIIVLALVLAGSLWGLWSHFKQQEAQNVIQASGTIQTTEIEVGSRIGGRITEVLAREGDNVRPGQVLVTLDPYQLPAQRAALQAQLAQAEVELTELKNGPLPQEIARARAQYQAAQSQASLQRAGARPEKISQAQASLRQAEATFHNDETNYHRYENLYQKEVISRQEFDNAKTTYENSLEAVNSAREHLLELERGNRPQEIAAARQQAQAQLAQLHLLEAGTRPEEIAQQKARIQNLRAQLEELNETVGETKIKASCPCQINSLDWRPGQLIAQNQTVASLYNLEDLWVRVYVPEERFGQMRVGDPVDVLVDAFPNHPFRGTVVQLASRAEFTPRNVQTEEGRRAQVFGVKIRLDNREQLLRPGMPADVTFHVAPVPAS